jgi:hypothetical protein
MATDYKFWQAAATTGGVDVFTVATSRSQVISSLVIANVTTSAATVRVHARLNGAAVATSNAIIYDASIPANSTVSYTLGMTFAAADRLHVIAGTSSALTVTAFGSEIY